MINKLILFIVCTLIASCSYNYSEDDTYAHIKKTEIVCKLIKVEQLPIHKSANVSLQTTSKCLCIKKESVIVSPHAIKEREKLEAMLDAQNQETMSELP